MDLLWVRGRLHEFCNQNCSSNGADDNNKTMIITIVAIKFIERVRGAVTRASSEEEEEEK